MTTAKTTAKTTKTAADDSVAQIETFAADAQASVNAQFEKLSKSFEDVAAFNQDTVEALVQTSNLAVKAAEELNAEFAAFSKKAVEENVAVAKELRARKNQRHPHRTAVYEKSVFEFVMLVKTFTVVPRHNDQGVLT